MSPSPDAAEAAPLPDDVATLKALLLAERATAAKLSGQNEHLRAIIKELQRALFGRRSEKATHPDQLQLALEDIEQAPAQSEAEAERADATLSKPTPVCLLPAQFPNPLKGSVSANLPFRRRALRAREPSRLSRRREA